MCIFLLGIPLGEEFLVHRKSIHPASIVTATRFSIQSNFVLSFVQYIFACPKQRLKYPWYIFLELFFHLSHEGEKVKGEVTQSCLALCNPVDCSPPGSSVHGLLQARMLEWAAISFSNLSHVRPQSVWSRFLRMMCGGVKLYFPAMYVQLIWCYLLNRPSFSFSVIVELQPKIRRSCKYESNSQFSILFH